MPLPAVLLRHARRRDTHYDLLLGDPEARGKVDARLVTFRVATPWWQWAALGRVPLTPLPPHRRAYLTYQGPVSGNRGHVTRVGVGNHTPTLWTPTRRAFTLTAPRSLPGRLHLDAAPIAPDRWIALVRTA